VGIHNLIMKLLSVLNLHLDADIQIDRYPKWGFII
jgi:hypothetical protein